MNKTEKANFISNMLNELFPDPQTQLTFLNNFTHLIAVILSAQCTDIIVNRVTSKLFKIATTPAEMVILGEENLKKIIYPCGFFNAKSKAIVNTAKMLLEKFNGEVPDDFESLESLPGVGHKTASVLMTQCFGQPAFPVDTHIARLANRWQLVFSKDIKKIEKTLKRIFPKRNWGKIHLQLILYGRKFCPAKGHILQKCPICLKFL